MAVVCAGWIAAASPVAQGASNGRLGIDGVDVEQVTGFAAGVPLRFTVYGTPGASVALRIEGGRRVLALREAEPGIYEGTYVIDARDAIGPASRVTATLQQGGELAHADLDESLLLAEVPLPWADAAARTAPASAPSQVAASPAPAIASVAPPAAPAATPQPVMPVPIAIAPVPTPERAPDATATRPPPTVASPVVVARGPERAVCDDCARVESVREVESRPLGAIGAIAGAIAGAVLGDELGREHNRRMTRVLGAIGGALAGREVERRATRRTEYDVVLRANDGRTQVRRYDHAPPFAPGATVRLGAVRGESAPAPF